MAEEHAGMNLVAEGDSECEDEDEEEDKYEDREEDEGWWVGTIGAVEMPSQEEETPSEADESEPERLPSDYLPEEVAGDGRWSPGPIQPYPAEGRQEPSNPRWGGFSTSAQQLSRIGPLRADHLAPWAPGEGS
jgi:hypothetical protein